MEHVIPVVCNLTEAELRERREKYLRKMVESLVASEDLDDGTRFQFRIGDSTLSDLAEITNLERKCCPFLSFKITIDSGSDLISLDMTGPGETKEIIRSLFNWN
ncbi:MAG TPA: hypothetical protein VL325_04575 [Pyrinomonadaceae bacterium]|jgi:hypothetical protein|nr:hypothetical protein [Pyrinomonadaceae bacterium]